jgi:hypothetical protein
MWHQIQEIGEDLMQISAEHPEGINLIGKDILEHYSPFKNVNIILLLINFTRRANFTNIPVKMYKCIFIFLIDEWLELHTSSKVMPVVMMDSETLNLKEGNFSSAWNILHCSQIFQSLRMIVDEMCNYFANSL